MTCNLRGDLGPLLIPSSKSTLASSHVQFLQEVLAVGGYLCDFTVYKLIKNFIFVSTPGAFDFTLLIAF